MVMKIRAIEERWLGTTWWALWITTWVCYLWILHDYIWELVPSHTVARVSSHLRACAYFSSRVCYILQQDLVEAYFVVNYAVELTIWICQQVLQNTRNDWTLHQITWNFILWILVKQQHCQVSREGRTPFSLINLVWLTCLFTVYCCKNVPT